MPDWTYHPFFKPLLFLLPAEEGRRLTLGILAVQARTIVGRRVFRLFGHGPPPAALAVTAFGVRFPTPIGLGPGIDTHGTALALMQHLGLGFVNVGPASQTRVPRRRDTDPLRIEARLAIASSPRASSASAGEIAARVRAAPELAIPVGLTLSGADATDAAAAIADAQSTVAFFTLAASLGEDVAALRRLRASTKKPLLLRLSPDPSTHDIDATLDRAGEAGFDGVVATGGSRCDLLVDGELDAPSLHARSLTVIERAARRADRLAIVAAGGVFTPDDALACLDAGATLVELYAGLVYAGPGLPGRIVHALERRLTSAPPTAPKKTATAPSANARAAPSPLGIAILGEGWPLVALTGAILIAAGAFALAIAASVQLLPYDVRYLGTTVEDLCGQNACRIVHFMSHDRVSFGGSIISIGVLYVWLAASPLRRGEAWAWWTLFFSGLLGFGSFLTYLGYGYLDVWHGWATVALLPVFAFGLAASFRRLARPRGLRAIPDAIAPAWLWSPAGSGRALVTFSAIGMILGGMTIMIVGMTRVFVPEDLAYMGTSIEALRALNPRLVPLIAHDRAGFGGGLCSGGVTVLLALWCGARPFARGLWWALFVAGVVGFVTAIGVHPIVGYTSFRHLLPAYLGALAFAVGITRLHRPMTTPQEKRNGDDATKDRFADF